MRIYTELTEANMRLTWFLQKLHKCCTICAYPYLQCRSAEAGCRRSASAPGISRLLRGFIDTLTQLIVSVRPGTTLSIHRYGRHVSGMETEQMSDLKVSGAGLCKTEACVI